MIVSPLALPGLEPSMMFTFEVPKDRESHRELRKLALSWRTKAQENIESARDEAARETFTTSCKVNHIIFRRIHSVRNFERFSIVICCSGDFIIRGIALTILYETPPGIDAEKKRQYIHLRFLATNPDNLLAGSRYFKAGTHILRYLFESCIRNHYAGVLVNPEEGALPFFSRFAFVPLPPSSGFINASMLWNPPKDIEVKTPDDNK